MTIQFLAAGALPYSYISGAGLAWASNTSLTLAATSAEDSNGITQIVIGGTPFQGPTTAAPLTINCAKNGINGLDTGSLAASTMYAVYVISASTCNFAPGAIVTLATNSAPLMPFGYDSYRLIGFWATDASSHFLLGYYASSGNKAIFMYDAPQPTAITSGTATSYTAIDLSATVPPTAQIGVILQAQLTPNAASDTLKLQPQGGTGDMVTVIGQVASVATLQQVFMTTLIASAKPEIAYKVSTASAHAAINVSGFHLAV